MTSPLGPPASLSLDGDASSLTCTKLAGEADALLPPDTALAVRDAVRSIYASLPGPELVAKWPMNTLVPTEIHVLRSILA